jgi:heme a synthase
MAVPRVTPDRFRRVTSIALVALAFIIVTGGAVRLTGSGLGCSDWPGCEDDEFIAPLELNPMVEQVNRFVTGAVSAAVIVAVLGSIWRVPRRRDLVWLSVGLVGGVLGQIGLGALTVAFHLTPPIVMAHFLVSLVLVANAVVLHHRAGLPDELLGRERPVVAREVAVLGRWLLAAAALALVTGTVVTGSGPHGGDEDVERLPFFVPDVARIHGVAVVLLTGAVLVLLWLLRRTDAPADVHRRANTLLAVIVAQAAVGYIQYFTGVPVVLVGVHILGAVAVWWATLGVVLGMRAPYCRRSPATQAAVGRSFAGAPSLASSSSQR